jgi:hypothetical protein
MKDLEAAIQAAKETDKVNAPITVARQNAYDKLNKYYNLSDKSHTLYAAATLFCPEQRMHYFDTNWDTKNTSKFKAPMRKAIRQEWLTKYRHLAIEDERPVKRPTILDRHLNRVSTTDGDQFDTYVEGMPVTFRSPTATTLLGWWEKIGPPQLRQMAYDLLSIPCTSCEIERAFSSAKKMVTPERSCLGDDTIEECELLRNWWLNGIVLPSNTMEYGDDDEDDTDNLLDLEGVCDASGNCE